MSVRIRQLVPVEPTASVNRECGRLLHDITSSPPGSGQANRARWDLEHLLMRLLHGGGLAAVEETVTAASAERSLTIARQTGALVWTGHDDQANANLRISVTDSDLVKSASVTWTPVPKPPAPPRTRTHRLQAQFYERYLAAGKVAYADPPGRLSSAHRLILTIGEFEADVNNGGFSQFLSNKGLRRAEETVRSLEAIRASKTALMLRSALAHASDDARLAKLDDRFYEVPEDLAVRTMTSLAAGASRRGATARAPRAPASRRRARGSASRRRGRK